MLKRIFDSVQPTLPGWVTFEVFSNIYRDWDITTLMTNGSGVGVVIHKGPELHVVYFSPPQFSIIKHIKQTLANIVAEHGYAETFVEPWNNQAMKFCLRLGFKDVGMKGEAIHMRCTVLNHVRQK
jgi:hypothetical protein